MFWLTWDFSEPVSSRMGDAFHWHGLIYHSNWQEIASYHNMVSSHIDGQQCCYCVEVDVWKSVNRIHWRCPESNEMDRIEDRCSTCMKSITSQYVSVTWLNWLRLSPSNMSFLPFSTTVPNLVYHLCRQLQKKATVLWLIHLSTNVNHR